MGDYVTGTLPAAEYAPGVSPELLRSALSDSAHGSILADILSSAWRRISSLGRK